MKTDAEVADIIERTVMRAHKEREQAVADARNKATPVTRGDLLIMLAALGDTGHAGPVIRLMKQRWGITQ